MRIERIAPAYKLGLSDLMVQDTGIVERLLLDDLEGDRHQRFVVRVGDCTVLVCHNIDLSLRIERLRVGDVVRFCGEYEWNELGGIVHWTHRDPNGAHPDGWIDHAGVRYG